MGRDKTEVIHGAVMTGQYFPHRQHMSKAGPSLGVTLEIKSEVLVFPNCNQRNTRKLLSKTKSFTSAEGCATDRRSDQKAH
jgi:hypothetical protein